MDAMLLGGKYDASFKAVDLPKVQFLYEKYVMTPAASFWEEVVYFRYYMQWYNENKCVRLITVITSMSRMVAKDIIKIGVSIDVMTLVCCIVASK